MNSPSLASILAIAACLLATAAASLPAREKPRHGLALPARWEYTAPLLSPEKRDKDPSVAQKDPTFVCVDGTWHVFMTVKLEGRSIIEYCSFKTWDQADAAERTPLQIADGKYYCAPQVFYFRPHKKWYLIYQRGVPGAKKLDISFSTTTAIGKPASWTRAKSIFTPAQTDPRGKGGLDFWVICDAERAYLFFTTLDGRMWRMSTKLADFPHGWGDYKLALRANIFEASHTYTLPRGQYLTVIEANPGGRRYYQAYLADRLDGEWRPLADTERTPFAGAANCRPAPGAKAWTDNISHGELLRSGNDETLPVDPANLRFVFQGALQQEKAGRPYGKIPWRLGLLTPAAPEPTKRKGKPAD